MSQPTFIAYDATGNTKTYFTPNPNGQTTSANSVPCVIANDQTPIPVALSGMPNNPWQFTYSAAGLSANGSQVAKAAGASSVRNYVTGVQLGSSGATIGATVTISDGSTVIWQGVIPLNGLSSVAFNTPLEGSPATALNIAIAGGIALGNYSVNLQGYQQ